MRAAVIAVATALALGLAVPTQAGELYVTSTAYNSVANQTDSSPDIAAWGDRLEPGMRVIAVSRDLLELGLTRGSEVQIEGFPGDFVVLDKMAKRWSKRIDIYMGEDVSAARRYGKRMVRIRWQSATPDVGAAAATAATAAAPGIGGE